jgi:hypothetical protein
MLFIQDLTLIPLLNVDKGKVRPWAGDPELGGGFLGNVWYHIDDKNKEKMEIILSYEGTYDIF